MRNTAPFYLFIFFFLAYATHNHAQEKILIVTSNQHTYGDTDMNASNHFSEIIVAYDVFVRNGFDVHFVSPEGGAIPIGYITTSDPLQKHYLYNSGFMNKLKNTKKPSQIDASNYKAIYYSGGGAAMFGVADNKQLNTIAEAIFEQNGIISAVCHGTAGIVNLKGRDGQPLYQNKNISGYPDLFENVDAAYFKTFPFSIEEKIRENKGNFKYSSQRNANFFIIDGNFITGQDPSSTQSVAKEVVQALKR
ncbi:MAG: type 1 glutamine amidotransferase domain-containing protein [Croceivirga sp.]